MKEEGHAIELLFFFNIINLILKINVINLIDLTV
jgi:hypothetical protein